MSSHKEFLSLFGWDSFYENQNPQLISHLLQPARVINEEKGLYRVQVSMQLALWASVSGKMQFEARGRGDFPAVGDWVLIEVHPQSERAIIQQICPRKSLIQRKQVGASSDVQILSTNVDFVFVTTSLNEELNFRRIERYLALAWESGATPVILLTKSDLQTARLDEILSEVSLQFLGVNVHALSNHDFGKSNFLAEYLQPGKTAVVVGSSGVGKSTLVNFIIGKEQIKTQEIRESDSKGKHTTTSRSLYLSRFGGLIIDTPGMRELQLADHSEGVKTQFADIEALVKQCRFTDCQHRTEPGCRVQEALMSGELLEERWESYHKLVAEVRFAMRKQSKAIAAEDKKKWKRMGPLVRINRKLKRGEI